MKGGKIWVVTFALLGAAAVVLPSWARQAQTQPSSAQTRPAAPSGPGPAFDPSKSDEKAIAIVDQVIRAMGGDSWAKAGYIKFTWATQRTDRRTAITHYWDRIGQRSRMEGPSREGKPVVATVDHRTREGQAALEGQPLTGEEAKKYVEIAYGRLINDSYWLFMPFKLKDPGVRLRYEGEVKAGPATYDKIQVSFDEGIGLTSKDKYWLYVNRDTHMIERWSYVLESMAANASPVAWEWTDWAQIHGMKLSMRKTQPGGDVDIVLEDVQVFDSLPESVFTSTAPVDLAATPQPAATP